MKFTELRKKSGYQYGDESDEHKHTKDGILHWLRKNDHVDRLYVREEFDDFDVNRVPDVGGIHKGKQLAIEVVHLNDDYIEYSKKKTEYHKNNIYDMWVFTSERMHEYIDENKPPSDLMIDLLKRYGCVYYYQDGKLIPVRYVDGYWKKSFIYLSVTWDNLCFAELKYMKYYCAEQKYEVDWLVAEAEDFVRYREQELENAEGELYNLQQNSLKSEKKIIKGWINFQEGIPVQCKFIGFDVNPKTQYPVTVFQKNDQLLYGAAHKNLKKQLRGHEGEGCIVTLIKQPSVEGEPFKYTVKFGV